MTRRWNPDSWTRCETRQLPAYDDPAALDAATGALANMPPLVFAGEVRALEARLAQVAQGNAFLLQAGDCAESFADFSPDTIRETFGVVLQMAAVLTYASKLPVVKLGRLAGQFAKPRSSTTEQQGNTVLPSYRGDSINGIEFAAQARRANPDRMLRAYAQSAATLNQLRSLASGGFAHWREAHRWTTDASPGGEWRAKFAEIADRIADALDFVEAAGIDADGQSQLRASEFFTSHEALLLPYEQALTRCDRPSGKYYATSAHFLWVGDRTRFSGSAHVEFLRGIANPIGIKCGPSLTGDLLLELLDTLNPERRPGRVTLIARMGADDIGRRLPPLIRAVEREGHEVGWSCDPMHANMVRTANGLKTRPFTRILSEARSFFDIHASEGSIPGGIHVEMTGEDVTECTGGSIAITDDALADRYHSHCDPRLNGAQSLELAFLIGEMLGRDLKQRASQVA